VSPDRVDRHTLEVGGGKATNTERQAVLSDTEGLRRSQRTRKPFEYLGEYYCGQIKGGYPSPSGGGAPSHYSYLPLNHATREARYQGRTTSMYYTQFGQSADLEVGQTQVRGSRDKPRTHTSFIPIAMSKHTTRNFISCHLTNMDTTPTHMNVEEESRTSPGESIKLRLPPISKSCLSGNNSKNSNSDSQNKFESWRNHTWNSKRLNSESPIEDNLLDQDIRSVTLTQP